MPDMNIEWIKQILPHRYPFLLIDRVLTLENSRSLTAIKNVTANESFFQGHFPEFSVMPGVLIVEAMAQASAILCYTGLNLQGKIVLFAGVDDVRFRRPVVPGDTLLFEVELTSFRTSCCKAKARATVDGQLVCNAKLMSFVTDVPKNDS